MKNTLREESLKLLNKWQLLKFLENYGKVYIVGSVELDVMTWRDIDLEVISDKTPTKEKAMEIASYLFSMDSVRRVSPIDYREVTHPKKPKGLYVGCEYIDEEKNKWKIDVWYLTPNSANSYEFTQNLKSKLSEKSKKIIVEIKNQLHDHPKYRKEIQSVDIYNAVLDESITSFSEFEKHLNNKDISL